MNEPVDGVPKPPTWPFPFPPAGRLRPAAEHEVPVLAAYRWPYRPLADDPIDPRGVRAAVSLTEFKQTLAGWCDDVGVISIDDPALDHERAEIRYVYPHARSLVCLIGEENKAAMQSRYLPSANNELYRCEERLWGMGRRTVNGTPRSPARSGRSDGLAVGGYTRGRVSYSVALRAGRRRT